MDIAIILFFIIGAVFGSFFNVIGLRVPKKEPFHNNRSFCPACKKKLHWHELVPMLSYMIQGGKCGSCHADISRIYPLTEACTGFLFAYSYAHLGFRLELMAALLLTSLLMIIFVSDMAYMRIPNSILLFFLPLLIAMRIISPLEPWYDAIIGGAAGIILIALIIIAFKGGMGAGDMKLFGVLGVVLGWNKVLLAFFLAAFTGAVIGAMLMLANKVKKKQPIPFGPFIVIGGLISYFYGEQILNFYMSLF